VPFRGSAIVPTILSFLSRALKKVAAIGTQRIPQMNDFCSY
jgi:hypothetical protein